MELTSRDRDRDRDRDRECTAGRFDRRMWWLPTQASVSRVRQAVSQCSVLSSVKLQFRRVPSQITCVVLLNVRCNVFLYHSGGGQLSPSAVSRHSAVQCVFQCGLGFAFGKSLGWPSI